MKKKDLVYIVHPYRAETEEGVKKNFDKAAAYARKAWKQGLIPIIPHVNSREVFGLMGGEDKIITEYDLYLLGACQRIWICGGRISKGMQVEIDFALENKITAFQHPEEV